MITYIIFGPGTCHFKAELNDLVFSSSSASNFVYLSLFIDITAMVLLVRGVAIAPSGWIMLEMRRRFGRASLALIPVGYFGYVIAGIYTNEKEKKRITIRKKREAREVN